MEQRPQRPHTSGGDRRKTWLALLAVLTLVNLWLDSALRVKAEASQAFDDALYVRLAGSLLSGDWLGPYDALTLVKLPLYSMWLALVHRLGTPLLVTQSALYAAAGLALVRELRLAGMGRRPLLAVYGAYLFNPFIEVRVMREGIYSSLLVLVFAALLRLRRGLCEGARSAVVGATLLGVALAAAWLTREEGLLLLPGVGIFYLGLVADVRSPGATHRALRLFALVVPFLVLGAATAGVCAANACRYGIFTVTELDSSAFASAFGSLMRVQHHRETPYALVPMDVRRDIYRVSPALASIEPFLDGNAGSVALRFSWMRNLCGESAPCPDYRGLWMMWALRQAAADAGYHRSAPEAARFYRRVADEISRACETGALQCGPPHNSTVPPWRASYGAAIARTLVWGTSFVLSVPIKPYVNDPDAPGAVSFTNPAGLERFCQLTGDRALPALGYPETAASRLSALDRAKLTALRRIASVYRFTLRLFVLAGTLAFSIAVAFAGRRSKSSSLLLLAAALLVTIAVRLLALSYIDVSMFWAFKNWPSYITPLYPLLILFAGVALGATRWTALKHPPIPTAPVTCETTRQGSVPPGASAGRSVHS